MGAQNKSSLPFKIVVLFGPFILFCSLVLIMGYHMATKNPNETNLVPNALAGKPAPATILPLMGQAEQTFDVAQLKGKVALVNFWGSWCPPCRQEHPILMDIAQDKRLVMIGINYKDNAQNGTRYINSFGNPYSQIGFDPKGQAAINWGVYGPPETFLLNKDSQIIYKHIGPITGEIYQTKLLPLIEKAWATPQPASP